MEMVSETGSNILRKEHFLGVPSQVVIPTQERGYGKLFWMIIFLYF
jgi:hypothetical protein